VSSYDRVFVGVTSWNSSRLLGACLDSVQATLGRRLSGLVVHDNQSSDDSHEIARRSGAEVIDGRVSQGEAMNLLAARSKAPCTLLLHSDVVLLAPDLLDRCAAALQAGAGLVAPEDIGCGPHTRPFGAGMPESSFLWFATTVLRKLRRTQWRRRWRLPYPVRRVDFYGPHVTHHLPKELERVGAAPRFMHVHASERLPDPIYVPGWRGPDWWYELFHLRYGLGNFYSLDGVITHYHNWYDRVPKDVPADSRLNAEAGGGGVPVAFLKAYTDAFLGDYAAGEVVVPALLAERSPRPSAGDGAGCEVAS
jgi:glycosyltransferase involved in cell wall biosynthesis